MHHISRSILADPEIGRRENISVAELLALAVGLDVALPPAGATGRRRAPRGDDGDAGDAGPGRARAWIRGTKPLPGTDRRGS